MHRVDFVRLEQRRDAAGELRDDFVLAREHLRRVHARIADADAVRGKRVLQFVKLLGGIQQRLGRNAADIQASAAQCRTALGAGALVDAHHAQAQLRGANRRHITARPAADDDDIVTVHGFSPPSEPNIECRFSMAAITASRYAIGRSPLMRLQRPHSS